MTVKIKKHESLKKWDTCSGNCKHCWPMVYKNCKSPKKVIRALLILEDTITRYEENLDTKRFIEIVFRKGFVEAWN